MPRAVLLFAALGLWCSCVSRRPPDGLPDAGRSSLVLLPGLTRADGSAHVVVRVEVRDSSGSPVPGALVRLSASCPGLRLRQPPAADERGVLVADARAPSPSRCRLVATLTAQGRTVLLDRADELVFAPFSRAPRLHALPTGRAP
jgi:hypothetical protein